MAFSIGAPVRFADLRAMFGHGLLGRMDERLGVVLRLDLRLALLVLFGVSFSILDHLIDVAFGQAARAWMRICCSLPVPLSLADTLTMPLASMST